MLSLRDHLKLDPRPEILLVSLRLLQMPGLLFISGQFLEHLSS